MGALRRRARRLRILCASSACCGGGRALCVLCARPLVAVCALWRRAPSGVPALRLWRCKVSDKLERLMIYILCKYKRTNNYIIRMKIHRATARIRPASRLYPTKSVAVQRRIERSGPALLCYFPATSLSLSLPPHTCRVLWNTRCDFRLPLLVLGAAPISTAAFDTAPNRAEQSRRSIDHCEQVPRDPKDVRQPFPPPKSCYYVPVRRLLLSRARIR